MDSTTIFALIIIMFLIGLARTLLGMINLGARTFIEPIQKITNFFINQLIKTIKIIIYITAWYHYNHRNPKKVR